MDLAFPNRTAVCKAVSPVTGCYSSVTVCVKQTSEVQVHSISYDNDESHTYSDAQN
jgi:hypothetical protein